MSKEILVYLYSNFSKSCAEFKTQINFLNNYLKIISVNIDCKKVRNMILNSKKIKVEYVPCLLIINEEGRLEVYENEQFSKAINNLYNVFMEKKQKEEQIAQQEKERQILEQLQQQIPTQTPQVPQYIPPVQSVQEDEFESSRKPRNVTNLNSIKNDKNKIGKTKFKLDKNIHPFSDDNMLMTVQRDRPEKGIGHSDLAVSSLPEIGLTREVRKVSPVKLPSYTPEDEDTTENTFEGEDEYEDRQEQEFEPEDQEFEPKVKPKKSPVKIGKNKVEMFEDFTGLLDETIDINEMRGAPSKKDDKTMKMDTVKKAAEQMMREREMTERK
jgi:hypothetical protein